MVPTRRLLILVALGIPLSALAAYAGVGSMVWAYNGLLLVMALVTYWLGPDARNLRVTRRFDPVLSVRVPNQIELEISNESTERMSGRFRDEPPPDFEVGVREFPIDLQPGRNKFFTYTVKPFERGADFFRGAFVRLECPLGLVVKQQQIPFAQPVRVYPNVLALKEFDLLKQKGMLRQVGIRKSRMRGLGTEFESLRDYSEGDDYRKIDWKASARRGRLVVKQFEQEQNQAVIVAIDIGRHMMAEVEGVRKLDRALDACLMLLHAASTANDQVGLLVYADRVHRYIPPKKGRAQIGVVLHAIHDLVAIPLETDHQAAMGYLSTRWKKRSLLVLFTDMDGPDSAREFCAAVTPLARRHLSLVARVSDPRVLALQRAPITDRTSFYDVSAASFVNADRRQVATLLETYGLHNLEAEPEDLSAALVSFYFVAKERALI